MTSLLPAPPADHRRASLRYLPGIDGLRAISVIAVLVYHYAVLGQADGLGGELRNWMPGGFMGVEVFFVISGYLITALLLTERRRTGTVSLRRFWLRRARRLLPPLFVMLAVVVLFALLFLPDSVEQLKRDVTGALTYTNNWRQINAPYADFEGRPPLLNHLWSLAIEEQFYLLWPPLLVVGFRKLGRQRTLLVTFGVALAAALLMAVLRGSETSITAASTAYFSTFTRLSGLLLGCALAFVWSPNMVRGQPGPGARVVINIAGLLGLYILWRAFRTWHFDDVQTFRGGFLLVDIATVLVIAAAVHPTADISRVLGIRPLQWIGLRSYGIYLWHYPIFAITRPGPNMDLQLWPSLVIALRFGLTIGLAALSYRYVEAPIRAGAIGNYVTRLRHSHGARRRQLALSGAGMVAVLASGGLLLGIGLAGAGEEDNQDTSQRGDAPDPEALAQLRAMLSTTTTVTTIATPTTAPGGAVDPAATAPPTAPPPPTVPAVPASVLAIGDSVMQGAEQEVEATIPGSVVDAVKSRQFFEAVAVFDLLGTAGLVPDVVVVHLGTNGRFGDGEFDHMMASLGPAQRVYFLTARMPRSWETEVNETLARGVSRHPNAQLLDWREFAGCHDDWFANDGYHVTDAGARGYADFLLAHVANNAGGLVYCRDIPTTTTAPPPTEPPSTAPAPAAPAPAPAPAP
ncbi:MAG: acyltransferase family protein [Actinomycetota bacterium]